MNYVFIKILPLFSSFFYLQEKELPIKNTLEEPSNSKEATTDIKTEVFQDSEQAKLATFEQMEEKTSDAKQDEAVSSTTTDDAQE